MPYAIRPEKPSDKFPLYAHASGQWAKKIRGTVHYFGTWDDPDSALQKYETEKSDLLFDRRPRARSGSATVAEVCNAFLTDIREKVERKQRSPHTMRDYYAVCKRVVHTFKSQTRIEDLTPHDFKALHRAISRERGFHAILSEVITVRTLFNSAVEDGLIERTPVYGKGFALPSRSDHERAMAEIDDEDRVFSAVELRNILESAGTPLKAMILLGINCAFGNSDISNLPIKAINFETRFARFPRPKTARPRKAYLWQETVDALNEAKSSRPTPRSKEDQDAFFLTRRRQRWVRMSTDTSANPPRFSVKDSLAQEFKKLMIAKGIHRRRISFYGLRHTFASVATNCRDQLAVDYVMGHVRRDDVIPSKYRHGLSDDRIVDVCEYVRSWLFTS